MPNTEEKGNFEQHKKRAKKLQNPSKDSKDINTVISELHIHQMELEIQNEELIKSKLLIEKSQGKYFDLFNLAPIGYFKLNEKGLITDVNLIGASMLGAKIADLIDKAFFRFISKDDLNKFHHFCKNQTTNEIKQNLELKLINNSGEPFYAQLESILYENELKKEILLSVTDITKIKNVENELKTSESRYKMLFENSQICTAITTMEGKVITANKLFFKMTGYEPEEIELVNLTSMYQNLDQRNLLIEKLRKTGSVREYEVKMKRKNGQHYLANINVDIVPIEEGNGLLVTAIDITKSRKIELKHIESEEFLDKIVENIPDIIFVKNADKLDFKMVNKSAETFFGHSREDLIGCTDHEFFPKAEADFFTKKDREVIKNKKPLDIPIETIKTKNLGQRKLHTKKIPILNKNGNPEYLLGVSEDITDLKTAEKLLVNSEKQYRTLYSAMNEGVAIHKLIYDDENIPVDYKIIDVNYAYEKILGIKKEDILNKKATEIYGTEKAPYFNEYLEVSQTGNPILFETFFEPMNKYFSISVSSPSYGSFVTVFEDITERKKIEETLFESEKNYRELVDNSMVAVYKTNIYGDILFANSAMAKILGYRSVEGLKKRKIFELYKNPEDRNKLIKKLKKQGNFSHYEVELTSKNDDTIIVLLSANLEDEIISGMMMDITQRKNAENEIKKSLSEKEVLIREIHHRVKNNLQIIASLLHLQEATVEGEEFINVLKESEVRVKSMAIIHEKLYQSTNFTDVNFKEYIEKLVYDILYTYGVQKGSIKTNMNIEDINLNIDTAIPLGLIINEIVTNSAKYAFPKSSGIITINLKQVSGGMELNISDNGIGLPIDVNLDNTSTLGLQLVKNLTDQIDGHIEIDRSNGTKFTINFKEIKYKKRK
jgi:PAS domain S-box-containing protein